MKKTTVNLTYKGTTSEHTLYYARFNCLDEPWLVSISPDWDFVPDTVKDGNDLVDSHIIKADDPATGDLYKQIHVIIDEIDNDFPECRLCTSNDPKWIQCQSVFDEDAEYAASDVARANRYIDTFLRDERGKPFERYELTFRIWVDGSGWNGETTIDFYNNEYNINTKANLQSSIRCGDLQVCASDDGSMYCIYDDEDIYDPNTKMYGCGTNGNCIAKYLVTEDDYEDDEDDE